MIKVGEVGEVGEVGDKFENFNFFIPYLFPFKQRYSEPHGLCDSEYLIEKL